MGVKNYIGPSLGRGGRYGPAGQCQNCSEPQKQHYSSDSAQQQLKHRTSRALYISPVSSYRGSCKPDAQLLPGGDVPHMPRVSVVRMQFTVVHL